MQLTSTWRSSAPVLRVSPPRWLRTHVFWGCDADILFTLTPLLPRLMLFPVNPADSIFVDWVHVPALLLSLRASGGLSRSWPSVPGIHPGPAVHLCSLCVHLGGTWSAAGSLSLLPATVLCSGRGSWWSRPDAQLPPTGLPLRCSRRGPWRASRQVGETSIDGSDSGAVTPDATRAISVC